MVTIYLCGGLGNQMFQYAFAKFLESKGFAVALEATHFLPESKEAFGLANASAGIGGGARYARSRISAFCYHTAYFV